MRWVFAVFVLAFLALGGFLLAESPIDSKAWHPPGAPSLDGPLTPNQRLQSADLLAKGKVHGPEDTTVDQNGVLYTGTRDGWIVRLPADGEPEHWLQTEGRPLGMVVDAQGQLIVADAWKGLLTISPAGDIGVLTREAEGQPFGFTDDVDVAPDGRIYFTDASAKFTVPDYMLDLLEMRPHGRFLRYNPATGKTEVLIRDLYFPNGVAVSPDGKYVLVNETWKYRIIRYWIGGPKAGTAEIFVDNLPGFPDNLAVDDQGRYWLALPSLRDPIVDALHTKPWLKELLAKVPDSLRPRPKDYGMVIVMNDQGQILASFHDSSGEHLKEITSVNPHNGMLYFGSLHNDRIGRLALPDISELTESPSD